MTQIAFILLCHKDPEAIIRQAEQLTAAGDYISIHFDASAPKSAFTAIQDGLSGNPNVAFAKTRISCGWGAWSLVQATLYALEAAVEAFPRATHFYMLSGDCMAVKSASYAHKFLERDNCDYIESFDFFKSDWIKTGIKEERLIYRHFFNERTQKWLFYRSFWLQRRFGLTRKIPEDLQIMIGSQWWCLRRLTVEKILQFTRDRRDVMRFFRTTWIPDETFFQTLVRHLVARDEIRTRTLTFLMFSDYGMPVTFYNDHYDMLLGQNNLFARKISPEAKELKERLGQLWGSERDDFEISGEGRALFKFMTSRGRVGQRFGARFWENETTVGRDRTVLIVACKKWHVAKRFAKAVAEHTGEPTYPYIFDEAGSDLPNLGGIEASKSKRTRHRRALVRMLFEHHGSRRLLFCIDTVHTDMIQDFYADRSRTRLLEIDCDMSDEYLEGHAMRVGLAGEQTSASARQKLLPTLRRDIAAETDRIRDQELEEHFVLSETAPRDRQISAITAFLRIPEDTANQILDTPHLFAD